MNSEGTILLLSAIGVMKDEERGRGCPTSLQRTNLKLIVIIQVGTCKISKWYWDS